MFFEVVFAIWMCIFTYAIVKGIKAFFKEKQDKIRHGQHIAEALPNHLVYAGRKLPFKDDEISEILGKHFPYYRTLNEPLQQKFRKRVRKFISSKIFIIRHNEGFKEMPVLISAAAIQITFGLDYYLLPYFAYIQIHPQEYFAEDSLRILAGHVKDNTITLAWNHFLKGFKEEDGSNVGLHEMAHALYFQHLVADLYKHKPFVVDYEDVMQKGEETFKRCRDLSDRLYSDYAFTNMQEFWAESLEIFFEKPAEMERLYPALFAELCDLLKQNPKYKENPLDMKVNAGVYKIYTV